MERTLVAMKVILCHVVLLFSATTLDGATLGPRSQRNEGQYFLVVRRESGWNVESLLALATTNPRARTVVEGLELYEAKLVFEDRPLLDSPAFSVHDGRLDIYPSRGAVSEGTALYTRSGKLIKVTLGLVGVDVRPDGARVYSGAMNVIAFVDDDGDGSLETRIEYPARAVLPDWVRCKEKK